VICSSTVSKRRRAQQLSETNRVARLTRYKQLLLEVQFDFIRFRDENCLLAERSGLCTSRYQEATHRSQTSATHALNIQQVGYGVRCRVNNGYDWTDIF